MPVASNVPPLIVVTPVYVFTPAKVAVPFVCVMVLVPPITPVDPSLKAAEAPLMVIAEFVMEPVNAKVPPLKVVPPVYVFAPAKVALPLLNVKEEVPPITPVLLWLKAAVALLTVIAVLLSVPVKYNALPAPA